MQLPRSATVYLNILSTVNGLWHPHEPALSLLTWSHIDIPVAFRTDWLWMSVFAFFSSSLSCTSSHLCSEPLAAEEIISDNRIRTICIYPLRGRSGRCTAHSDSWGQGQIGALIGPVKAPNTPLWSELTAIGWLFISNRIAVDPLAEGLQLLFFLQVAHLQWIPAPDCQNAFKIENLIHSHCFQDPGSPGRPNSGLRKWGVHYRTVNWPNNRFLKSIFRNGLVYWTILGLIMSFSCENHQHNKEEIVNPSTSLSHSECTVCYYGNKSQTILSIGLSQGDTESFQRVCNSAPKTALCCILTCWGNMKLVSGHMKDWSWLW